MLAAKKKLPSSPNSPYTPLPPSKWWRFNFGPLADWAEKVWLGVIGSSALRYRHSNERTNDRQQHAKMTPKSSGRLDVFPEQSSPDISMVPRRVIHSRVVAKLGWLMVRGKNVTGGFHFLVTHPIFWPLYSCQQQMLVKCQIYKIVLHFRNRSHHPW